VALPSDDDLDDDLDEDLEEGGLGDEAFEDGDDGVQPPASPALKPDGGWGSSEEASGSDDEEEATSAPPSGVCGFWMCVVDVFMIDLRVCVVGGGG
jgi:hypothetical protein